MAKQPSRLPKHNTSNPKSLVSHSQSWNAPLPPPSALEHYNQVLPNAAERIFNMAESEQLSRHAKEKEIIALERENLSINKSNAQRASYLSIGFAVVCVILAFVSFYLWANIVLSGMFIGIPLLTISIKLIETIKK